jgi:hypothetical protein
MLCAHTNVEKGCQYSILSKKKDKIDFFEKVWDKEEK